MQKKFLHLLETGINASSDLVFILLDKSNFHFVQTINLCDHNDGYPPIQHQTPPISVTETLLTFAFCP